MWNCLSDFCRPRMSRLVLAASLLPLLTFLAHAGAPVVERVDPPGWFTDLSCREVLLLLQGQGLEGARLESPNGALKVVRSWPSGQGRYLFAELRVAAGAHAGSHPLRLVAGDGSTQEVAFELMPSCRSSREPAGFSPREVVYLVMPDRWADGDTRNNLQASTAAESSRRQPRGWHGGDFAGLSAHLDYLQGLGAGAVWLTPICENDCPTSYHGYHSTNFYRPDPHFGSMEELEALVQKAHGLGLRVILDLVVNHTGWTHPWVQNPPTPTWYNGTSAQHLSCDWNIPALCSPHATEATRRPTLEGWFAGILPDLNGKDPLLIRYLTQNAIWWVGRTGIDGIRLDTYPYTTEAFWKEWFPAMRKEFPKLRVVGEVMEWKPAYIAFWQNGFARREGPAVGPDSLMDFPGSVAMRDSFKDEKGWGLLRDVYAQDHLYPDPTMLFSLLDNHDCARFCSSIGNRGAAYRCALAANLLLRGIPQLYAGDELAMTGENDPDNRKDFPGGFPGDTVSAFTGAGLDPDASATLDWTRLMLGVRKTCPALQSGTFTELFADRDTLLVLKEAGASRALVLLHRTAAARQLAVPAAAVADLPAGTWRDALGGPALETGQALNLTLAPYDVKIWIKE